MDFNTNLMTAAYGMTKPVNEKNEEQGSFKRIVASRATIVFAGVIAAPAYAVKDAIAVPLKAAVFLTVKPLVSIINLRLKSESLTDFQNKLPTLSSIAQTALRVLKSIVSSLFTPISFLFPQASIECLQNIKVLAKNVDSTQAAPVSASVVSNQADAPADARRFHACTR